MTMSFIYNEIVLLPAVTVYKEYSSSIVMYSPISLLLTYHIIHTLESGGNLV